MSERDARTTPRRAGFLEWWARFNAELAKRGLPEATLDQARTHAWYRRPPGAAAEWEALANGR